MTTRRYSPSLDTATRPAVSHQLRAALGDFAASKARALTRTCSVPRPVAPQFLPVRRGSRTTTLPFIFAAAHATANHNAGHLASAPHKELR